MAIKKKTRNELVRDLRDAIRLRDTTVETGYGPVKDLVIDPVSLVVSELYDAVENVYNVQFLQNASIMSREDLDNLGETLGVTRKGPMTASGSVFFLTSSKPSADIIVPLGFPITTAGGTNSTVQTFVTTRETTLYAASAAAYFNAQTGNFELEVPVKALSSGAAGTVAAGSIRTMARQLPGFSGVTNKSATYGGRDAETNENYARRIRLALRGLARGTSSGLRSFALKDGRVLDALVVRAGDALMQRAESAAGAIDVYVQGEEPVVYQQLSTYTGADIYFEKEPLIFPTPIMSVSGSISGALDEGTHYYAVQDTVFGATTRGRNILRWNRAAAAPVYGETITIQYTYDKLIADLQLELQKPENDLLADVLFSRSTEVPLYLAGVVRITPDFGSEVVDANIRSAVREFINSRGLGESIYVSDLDVVIRGVPGVDYVVLPFTQLSRAGQTGNGTVTIEQNEYASISDAAINLSLTV